MASDLRRSPFIGGASLVPTAAAAVPSPPPSSTPCPPPPSIHPSIPTHPPPAAARGWQASRSRVAIVKRGGTAGSPEGHVAARSSGDRGPWWLVVAQAGLSWSCCCCCCCCSARAPKPWERRCGSVLGERRGSLSLSLSTRLKRRARGSHLPPSGASAAAAAKHRRFITPPHFSRCVCVFLFLVFFLLSSFYVDRRSHRRWRV